MSEIDDVMYEDDVSLAVEARERAMERVDFQRRLEEKMLENELIEEVDLSIENLGEKGFVELADDLISNQESVMTEFEQDDIDAGTREWSEEYDSLINNPPKDGDILTTSTSDANVLLMVELKEDSPPFIYGRAYVPEIVGHSLGWYLLDSKSQSFHGWKCILLPRARTELIRKFGLQHESMEVRSLRVIRPSQSGKSLLCEVHEYCKEEKAEVFEEDVSALPNNLSFITTQEEDTSEAMKQTSEAQKPEVSLTTEPSY